MEGAWKVHWVCMGSAIGGNGEADGAAGSAAAARAEEPAEGGEYSQGMGVRGGGRCKGCTCESLSDIPNRMPPFMC